MKSTITTIVLIFAVCINGMAQSFDKAFLVESVKDKAGERTLLVKEPNRVFIERTKTSTILTLQFTPMTDSPYKVGAWDNAAFIEDAETGTHYKLRKIIDWQGVKEHKVGKNDMEHFFTGTKGEPMEIRLEFPALEKNVRLIRFWHVEKGIGTSDRVFAVNTLEKNGEIRYDKKLPKLIKMSLIQDGSKYNPEDKYTFPIYGDEVSIVPPYIEGDTYDIPEVNRVAIWCTKECTIVASIYRLLWDKHYFQQPSGDCLMDCKTGKLYKVLENCDGTPMDMSFNIQGVAGEWVCMINKYPPLPKECTTISFVNEDVTDNVKNGLGWGPGTRLQNVPIARLQANQDIVKFQKTKVIK